MADSGANSSPAEQPPADPTTTATTASATGALLGAQQPANNETNVVNSGDNMSANPHSGAVQQQQQHLHPNDPRVRRIRIRAPEGGMGSVRLSFNGGRVSVNQGAVGGMTGPHPINGFGSINGPLRGVSHNSNNFNHHINNIQSGLPKLEAHVLPDSQQDHKDDKPDDDEKFNAFKCSICYDLMKDPSGCGKCSARFCLECLKKVAYTLRQGDNLKCPICRSQFEPGDVQQDFELKNRMEQAPPIPCRYKGCDELCSLTHVADHEAQCPHVNLQCCYKPFGCPWTGKRSDLKHHEESDCYLAKISDFVNRHRQMQADFSHRIAHLQQTIAATGGMLEVQRMRERQSLCTSNIFHIMQFIHTITCCTPHFLLTKDSWAPFHFHPRGRAKVVNFATLVPTYAFTLRSIRTAYQQVLSHASYRMDTEEKVLDFIDAILNFLILASLAIIICLSFFVDGSTPDQWVPLPIASWWPRWLGGLRDGRTSNTTNVLQYAVNFGFAGVFAFVLEMYRYENVTCAVVLWFFLVTTSTIFPALLTSMIEHVNSPPTAEPLSVEKVLSIGRAVKPVLFGLRYGPLAAAFGPIPCLDAGILVYLGQDVLKRFTPNSLLEHEAFLSRFPAPVFYFYGGGRVAMKFVEFQNASLFQTIDSVIVAFLLLVTNFVVVDFVRIGISIGAKILASSRSRMAIDASGLRIDYNELGMTSCCFWLLCVAALAFT